MKILPLTPTAANEVGQLAERRLRESPYFFLKNVSCEFAAGVLTLRGKVPYEQLKDFAEAIVSRVPGVVDIVNRVEVIDPLRPPLKSTNLRNAG